VLNNSALASRKYSEASEVVTSLRRPDTAPALREAPGEVAATLTIDNVIREISDLRLAIREAFVAASPEYQLLNELTENGLRDCAKCLRELESRAAQHPYNKMLLRIDAAYDTARNMTRAGAKF
jgi:hypothetical protein